MGNFGATKDDYSDKTIVGLDEIFWGFNPEFDEYGKNWLEVIPGVRVCENPLNSAYHTQECLEWAQEHADDEEPAPSVTPYLLVVKTRSGNWVRLKGLREFDCKGKKKNQFVIFSSEKTGRTFMLFFKGPLAEGTPVQICESISKEELEF